MYKAVVHKYVGDRTTRVYIVFFILFRNDSSFIYFFFGQWALLLARSACMRRLHTASGPRPFSRSIPVGPPVTGRPKPTAQTTLYNLYWRANKQASTYRAHATHTCHITHTLKCVSYRWISNNNFFNHVM